MDPQSQVTRFCVVALFLTLISMAFLPTLGSTESDPTTLQHRGSERIDHYIHHFRKTGDAETYRRELSQASDELTASYEAFLNRGDLAAAAWSAIRLGDSQRMQNAWQQAVAVYSRAYDLAKQAKHIAYQAQALMGQGRAELYGLRDYGAAATHIEQAVSLSSQLTDKSFLFRSLDYLAQLQVSRGELVAAADTLNRAFAMAETLTDRSLLFSGYLDRAEVYQKLAEKCDYQRTFAPCYEALQRAKADYEQALAIARQLGYDGLAEQATGFLRRLEERRSLIQTQERLHNQLIQQKLFHPQKPSDVLVQEQFIAGGQHIPAELIGFIQKAGGFSGGDARSLYVQGLSHDMQGDNDAALASYLKAVEILEVDRRNLREEKSRGTFLEDKIEFYYTPILHLLERRRMAEAFELLERSRARAMADLLASKQLQQSKPRDRELYAASLQIKTTIAQLQKELFRLRSQADREQYAASIATIEQNIQRLEGEHRRLAQRMTIEAPSLLRLLVSQPVSLQQFQQSMRQDRYEVLQYLVLESAVIVWHIGGDTVHVRSVSLPRSEVIHKVARLRRSLTDKNVTFDAQTARELFLFLIQPVLQWVRTDHLVIMPHEDLNYIPFQVLQNPADNRYLGERLQISYASSATILLSLQQAGNIAKGRLLAVADPDIIEAPDEVETIARLYPSTSRVVSNVLVKEAALKTLVGEYNLLHLSVHGVFDPQEPLLSHLKFRADNRDDGKLTAAEIFGLPLGQARLVVLSACETGQVEATHANEILGLVHAFLYAGAQSLVLSSWKVDSASTALWMETFYREVQTQPLSVAAHKALMVVQQRAEYRHPYYWGAFSLIGK